jgi:SAM-dependent methyltransferase
MKSVACGLCGGEKLTVFGDFDLWVSNEAVVRRESVSTLLVRCGDCGVVFCDSMPTEELHSEYEDSYYAGDIVLEEHIRFLYFLRFNKLRAMMKPDDRILDFGCGKGYFLDCLRQRNFSHLTGVDLNQHALESLRQRKYTVGDTIEKVADRGPFDCITLFHVLEHIDQPALFLRSLKPYLRPGGRVVIEVPNIRSYGFSRFSGNWFYLQREHLYYFNPESLHGLARSSGFQVESNYDFGGFWVTKGKSGRNNLIKLPFVMKTGLIYGYFKICDWFNLHDFSGIVLRNEIEP